MTITREQVRDMKNAALDAERKGRAGVSVYPIGMLELIEDYERLKSENSKLYDIVNSECFEHAGNCCDEWCKRCQYNVAARSAL